MNKKKITIEIEVDDCIDEKSLKKIIDIILKDKKILINLLAIEVAKKIAKEIQNVMR